MLFLNLQNDRNDKIYETVEKLITLESHEAKRGN